MRWNLKRTASRTTQSQAKQQSNPSDEQHMKPTCHKGSRQQRRRRSMLNAAAVLAAAWTVPHRCCQALRVSCSAAAPGSRAGYQYRGYVGTAAQRASKTTARVAGDFVPGGAGRRKMAASAVAAGGRSPSFGGSGGGGFVSSNGHGQRQRSRGATATGGGGVRMVSGGGSDEGQFFSDPDAPLELDGVGPPGPLGDDQV